MTHAELVEIALRWLWSNRRCAVACAEIDSTSAEKPDAIGWKTGVSYLVECKVSRADFLADRKKPWRQGEHAGMGTYRYFLTPPGLVKVEELPEGWGLLEVHAWGVRTIHGHPEVPARTRREAEGEVCMLLTVIRRMLNPDRWPDATNRRVLLYGEPLAGGFVEVDGVRTWPDDGPPPSEESTPPDLFPDVAA